MGMLIYDDADAASGDGDDDCDYDCDCDDDGADGAGDGGGAGGADDCGWCCDSGCVYVDEGDADDSGEAE